MHRLAASEDKSQGGAVGGKTARACDACIRRRARWFCAADDAFLCQSCDSSIHSANPLGCRHQRVRLKTASSSTSSSSSSTSSLSSSDVLPIPAWLKGFTRKARTPRSHHHRHIHYSKVAAKLSAGSHAQQRPLSSTTVPDLSETIVDDNEEEEEEEQLLYRVPVFDPALAEFCSPPPPLDDSNASSGDDAKMLAIMDLSDATLTASSTLSMSAGNRELADLFPSDMELAEFAANMESLLGNGTDVPDDSFCMEKLGLVEPNDGDDGGMNCCLDVAAAGHVKAEPQLGYDDGDDKYNCQMELEIDVSKETLELNFDWASPMTGEEQEEVWEEKAAVGAWELAEQGQNKKAKLKLDYEAIATAWTTSQGSSPWTDGKRPQISLDSCWPADYIGLYGGGGGGQMPGVGHGAGEMAGAGHGAGEMAGAATHGGDGGREARVTRYREKRRTRLFSKKIRYEVRKLNAEKRPRMKGRFVKRAPGMAIAH